VSHEIHPDSPPEGVLLERVFGPGVAQHQEGQRRRCAELGLPFEAPKLLSNSRFAVEAAEFARDAGLHPEFHRAVLTAYFYRSQDIGDPTVLGEVAAEVGMDSAALQRALEMGQYTDRRRAAHDEARRLDIRAVPTYIFVGGDRIVGAQALDVFRRLLADIMADEAS